MMIGFILDGREWCFYGELDGADVFSLLVNLRDGDDSSEDDIMTVKPIVTGW